jgi:polysaccharide export outer membrane protein
LIENQIDPTFSLEVSEYNSQRVAVGGNVKNAQIVPITPNNLTLGEALIAAGGFDIRDREFANIRVYRDGTLYQIPLVIFDENPSIKDKLLVAGDAVYVDTTYDLDRALEFYESKIDVISLQTTARASALNVLRSEIELRRASLEETRGNFERRNSLNAIDRDYVYLTGEVTEQSRVPLPYEQTASLADVLFGEGGFPTETGNPSQIYVMRASNSAGEMIAYHLDARSAGNLLLATKFHMRPDDVVFIEEQPITRWNRALQQAFPTLINVAAQSVR